MKERLQILGHFSLNFLLDRSDIQGVEEFGGGGR